MSIELIQYPNLPPQLPDSTTLEGQYVVDLTQGLVKKGYDIKALLANSGISPNLLDSPGGRISFRQLADLSINIIDLLNDEFYGLIDKPQRRGTFKLLCYSCISADTIGEAMALFAEFMNLLENTWQHQIEHSDTHCSYRLLPLSSDTSQHLLAAEYFYSSLYRTLCWLAKRQIPLAHVDLATQSTAELERYRFMFYDAPLRFGQPQTALHFPSSVLDYENVRNRSELDQFLRQSPLTLLTQTVPVEDFSSRARIFIERQLDRHGKVPSINETAAHLGLHAQTFRRKLHGEHSSYSAIKANARRDLAISMIIDGRKSVAEVSEALDFSEPSAFIRAFKRWIGVTPKTYRRNMSVQEPQH